MTQHFLRDDDLTPEQRDRIFDMAVKMRTDRFAYRPLEGPKSVALIFDKPSTRTRVSFMTGIADLGGNTVLLDHATTQIAREEPIADTARVLAPQVEAIVWRTFAQSQLDEMASASTVPVVNALSNEFHPCQLLADLLTIRDTFGTLRGLTVAYFGDISNNMAHSYLLACASEGMHIRLAGPTHITPREDVLRDAEQLAQASGGSVVCLDDPKLAASEAHVLATDTWMSMGAGDREEWEFADLLRFQLDQTLLECALPEAIVLHCLPAYRGKEISADVLEGEASRVWIEAENRLYAQKALLVELLTPGSSK